MSHKSFGVSVRGRVKNTALPMSHSLHPLLEAIANSLESIHDQRCIAPNEEYRVTIAVEYDTQKALNIEDLSLARSLKSFTIEDNGIGFNDANFDSFLTSDEPASVII